MFILLALLVLAAGTALVVSAVRKRSRLPKPSTADTARAVSVGVLVFFVGFTMLGTGLAGQEAVPRSAVQAALPTPTPQPVAAAPSGRTDIQNLAIVAGVSENDAELTRQYARLQSLCPPANVSVADLVVNLQQMVSEESSLGLPLVDVMRHLATAQEGGQAAGMTCSETGAALAGLLIGGG